MKPTVISFLVLALLGMASAAPFQMPGLVRMNDAKSKDMLTEEDTPFCRLHQGVSKCVGKPLDIRDNEPWCPYRMCGPSLIPAALCPKDPEHGATNKCSVTVIERSVYKCNGKAFGTTYVPLKCVPGSKNCKEVNTCSCMKVRSVKTAVLKDEGTFKPRCPEKSG